MFGQMKDSIKTLFPSWNVDNLSEAELAQKMADEAASLTPPAIESATESTPATPQVDLTEITQSIETLTTLTNSLQSLVEAQNTKIAAQNSEISAIGTKLKSVETLNTVLANKVAALNVSQTTAPKTSDEAVNVVNKLITDTENDANIKGFDMADFMNVQK